MDLFDLWIYPAMKSSSAAKSGLSVKQRLSAARMEFACSLVGGGCLVMLATTCRVTTDYSKTCISFAVCGSLISIVKTSMVHDWLEVSTPSSVVRMLFGFCFFLVLACQVAITLLKLYTCRRDGVPFDEVSVPFEEYVEDMINPILERWGFTEEQLAKDATAIGLDGWRPQGVSSARSRRKDARQAVLDAGQASALEQAATKEAAPLRRLTGKQRKKQRA